MRLASVSVTSLRNIALFLAILLVTIAWPTTTSETYQVFLNLRNYVLVPAVVILVSIILLYRRPLEFFLAVGGCLILLTIASIHGRQHIHVGQLVAFRDVATYFMVNAILLALLAGKQQHIISAETAKYFLIAAGTILCYTVYVGGLYFDDGPRFIYSYVQDDLGVNASYSQGVSKFYGLAAVSAFLYLQRFKGNRYLLGIATIFFLLVSFFGGGRGDFLAAILTIIVFSKLRLRHIAVMVFLIIMLMFVDWESIMAVVPAFRRYEAMLGSFGYRDVLVSQSLQLLGREPQCLLWGCGIGFFQFYWGYPSGMYPHNLILESIISYGAVFTLIIAVLFLMGCGVVYRREGRGSFFLAFSFFFLVVGLKSGGLLTSWITSASVLLLASIGLMDLVKKDYGLQRR